MKVFNVANATHPTRFRERVGNNQLISVTTTGVHGSLRDYTQPYKYVLRPRLGDFLVLPSGDLYVCVPNGMALRKAGPFKERYSDRPAIDLDLRMYTIAIDLDERAGEEVPEVVVDAVARWVAVLWNHLLTVRLEAVDLSSVSVPSGRVPAMQTFNWGRFTERVIYWSGQPGRIRMEVAWL